MDSAATPQLGSYTTIAACGLLLGVVFGSPTLIALGAPFAVYLAVAFAITSRPTVSVGFQLDRDRVIEGEEFSGTINLATSAPVSELEVAFAWPPGVTRLDGPQRELLSLPEPGTRSLPLTLRAEHWGAYRLGEVVIRTRDSLGLISRDRRYEPSRTLRAYPAYERLRTLMAPSATEAQAGAHVARTKGDGIEFADVRPFVTGDQLRRINWRHSARRQTLYVNESHPERSSDVVLFLDSFTDVAREEQGTLDTTVRAAGSLARAYLQQRDRVGIIGFGGVVRWLVPSMGRRQIYRIVEALLETQVSLSYAWKGVEVLPPRTLPPRALVIALTPLLDERSAAALLDLRARGFDLVIVEISPLPFIRQPKRTVERQAQRLWPLWRGTLRYRYEQLGVAVVEWGDAASLIQLIEEARGRRRHAYRTRV